MNLSNQFVLPSPITELDFIENSDGVKFYVKRDDLIHPYISGNKYRKLAYLLKGLVTDDIQGILTFGGAYSNHILATAAAAKLHNLKSVGIVRGDELNSRSNETLTLCEQLGMKLIFVNREEYRKKEFGTSAIELLKSEPDIYLIPEGGSNQMSMIGVGELLDEILLQMPQVDYIVVGMGTGGTMAGLVHRILERKDSEMLDKLINLVGVPVLKGIDFSEKLKNDYNLNHFDDFLSLEIDYHFGGYGKSDDKLVSFKNQFEKDCGFLIDKVYNAKVAFALLDLNTKQFFRPGSKVVWIDTGGLRPNDYHS